MQKLFGGRKTTHNLTCDNEMRFDSASRQTLEMGGGSRGKEGVDGGTGKGRGEV